MFYLFHDNYTERGSITTKHTFKFEGYGLDAQAIYREYVTRFSIARGVICTDEPTGNLYETDHDADDDNGNKWPLKRYNHTFVR